MGSMFFFVCMHPYPFMITCKDEHMTTWVLILRESDVLRWFTFVMSFACCFITLSLLIILTPSVDAGGLVFFVVPWLLPFWHLAFTFPILNPILFNSSYWLCFQIHFRWPSLFHNYFHKKSYDKRMYSSPWTLRETICKRNQTYFWYFNYTLACLMGLQNQLVVFLLLYTRQHSRAYCTWI